MAGPGGEPANWVDPDVVAYYEASGGAPTYDLVREREFKTFFETGWLDPRYDDLRERWDPRIKDEDPYGRVLGKTALWSLVQLRESQGKIKRT